MTKRKRDIFTVVEAVPNWFEAGGSEIALEFSKEEDHGAPVQGDPPIYVAGAFEGRSATWSEGHEGHPSYVAGEVVGESANWALNQEVQPAHVAGQSEANTTSWAHNQGMG